jgi:hypothetical protein
MMVTCRSLLHSSVLLLCVSSACGALVWGFDTTNDVSKDAAFETDLKTFNGALSLVGDDKKIAKSSGFSDAKAAYTTASEGKISMQSMSTGIGDSEAAKALKLTSDTSISFLQLFGTYWTGTGGCISGSQITGCPNYADPIVLAMLDKTGDYATSSDSFRSQGAKKFVAYQVVWQHIMHKLSAVLYHAETNKTMSLLALDESWATFTGTNALVSSYYNTVSKGLVYNQCGERRNDRIRDLYTSAKTMLGGADMTMASLSETIHKIPPILTSVLVQACMIYVERADGLKMDSVNTMNNGSDVGEILGEAWGFCGSVLPLMNAADAKVIDDMIRPTKMSTINKVTAWSAFTNSYSRMGITSSDVGTYSTDVITLAAVCASSGSVMRPMLVSIVVAAVAAVAAVFAA